MYRCSCIHWKEWDLARRRTGSVLSENAEEARGQLLTAAEAVFERYGVAKTTMDDIGREAGVSRPTVYRYFKDRDSLISGLIERRARAVFAVARSFIDSKETFAEKFVEGMVFLIDKGRQDPVIRILVSPETMQMAQPLVDSSGLAARLTTEMWGPVISEAIEKGEVRPELDVEKVCEWIALLEFILVGRLDFGGPDDPAHRDLLQTFVLPALVPAEVPVKD